MGGPHIDYPLSLKVLRERRGARCRDCNGPKEPGSGRIYCLKCAGLRSRGVKLCACGQPKEKGRIRYCAECAARSRREPRGRRAERKPCRGCGGPKPAGCQVYCPSCAPVPPDRREDCDAFPGLPGRPLAVAVERMIQATARDCVHSILMAEGIYTDDGNAPKSLTEVARDDCPSVRESVCARVGISSKRLYEWDRRPIMTPFDVADKVVTRGNLLWWEVWVPCASGCEGVHGPPCLQCHGHMLARRAFEGE